MAEDIIKEGVVVVEEEEVVVVGEEVVVGRSKEEEEEEEVEKGEIVTTNLSREITRVELLQSKLVALTLQHIKRTRIDPSCRSSPI